MVDGLKLHTPVIGVEEEAALCSWVDELIAKGRRGDLVGTTFLEPKRWKKGASSSSLSSLSPPLTPRLTLSIIYTIL